MNLLQEIERLKIEVDSSKNGQIQAQDIAMKALDDKLAMLQENKRLIKRLNLTLAEVEWLYKEHGCCRRRE